MKLRDWAHCASLVGAVLVAACTGAAAQTAAAAGGGDAGIRYTLPRAGRVSAAVYREDGTLVRELRRGERQSAGAHTLEWDGLNADGTPQPPGEYTWRALLTPGFVAEYITSLGIRPGSSPYDTWVGNHGGTAAVAVDAGGLYAAATVTETAPVLLSQSLDGRTRLWTRGRGDVTRGRFQGGVALAANGRGRLFMLQQNGFLQVIDAEAGKRLATWDMLPSGQSRNREEGDQFYRHGDTVAPVDLAAAGDTLVLSDRARNRVFWLDPETGAIRVEREIEKPGGIAVAPDGTLYVISGRAVLALRPDGVARTVIGDGLDAPARIAYDPAGPHLLVVEWGERHQIRRFDTAGRPLAVYGRAGGRLDGAYVPGDFLQVTSIAADGAGGFVISEQAPAPRRVAHFDREGHLVKEWYGGQPYYAWGEPDPRDPTLVWFNPDDWLTLARIDPAAKTWSVVENYRQTALGGGLILPLTGHRGRWRALERGGRRYLVGETAPQVLEHTAGRLRAVTAVGNDVERLARARHTAGHEATAQAFRWIDTNGDGLPQAGEIAFSDTPTVPDGDRGVADNFELLTVTSGRDSDKRAFVRVLRTAPRWTEQGPVYPFGDEPGISEIAGDVTVDSPAGTGGNRGLGAFRDRKGNYYAHYNTGDDWHGSSWPTYWGGRSRLVQWDAEGRERWRVGRHAIHGGLGSAPHTTPPGCIHVGAGIIGEIRDTVIMADRVEWMGSVWTRDGLYVGNVLDGRMDDGLPDTVYYWWRTPAGTEAIITSDNATGGAIVEATDGSVWFFTQGRNSVPAYRIHGWDDWLRFEGRLRRPNPAPHAAGTGTGLTAAYFKGLAGAADANSVAGIPPPFAVEPAAVLVEPRVWHGSPRRRPANDEVIDGVSGGPAIDWSRGIKALGEPPVAPPDRPAGFAVRWTGTLEAPMSEAFTFSTYARGGVRLWLDGRQLIFGWNEAAERRESAPVRLEAGRRYALQLEFFSTQPYPACSLNWESFSWDRRRIGTAYLYPDTPTQPAREPDPRNAHVPIPAASFDRQSGHIGPGTVRGERVSGLRQRGFGVSGSWIGFQRLDFGQGVSRVMVRGNGHPAGAGDLPVKLELRLDRPDGTPIGEVTLSEAETSEALVQPVKGVRDVYVVNATRRGWHFINLSELRFE